MDAERLVLRAAVNDLLHEKAVNTNIIRALKNLSVLLANIDQIIHAQRLRMDSRWLVERFEMSDLKNIGTFRVTDHEHKGSRIISFTESDDKVLEFVFEATIREKPKSMMRQIMNHASLLWKLSVPHALMYIFFVVKLRHPLKALMQLLDGKPRALDGYRVKEVAIVLQRGQLLQYILPKKRKVLFSES